MGPWVLINAGWYKTLAQLQERTFEHHGYEFRQWEYSLAFGSSGEAWIAKKTVETDTVNDAIQIFRSGLMPVVDRISFVSQCFAETELEPFAIYRRDGGGVLFLRFTEDGGSVPLDFDVNEVRALEQLEAFEEKGDVFRYIRESTSAGSFYTTLAMLIPALEAIAGEREATKGAKSTNLEFIRDEILKDDTVFENLYRYGEGIRPKLFHGSKVDLNAPEHHDINYVERLYAAIINYFNEKHDLKINTNVVKPQRSPYGNYQLQHAWLQPKRESYRLELRSLCETYSGAYGLQSRMGGEDEVGGAFDDQFDIVDMPPGY